jgi:hypothetical protein
MAFELTTFADLKKLLELGDSLISDYPRLEVLKPAVEAAFSDHCQRDWESVERTETFRPGNIPTRMIPCRAIPVSSVSSVTVTSLGEDTTLAEDVDFEISDYGIRTVATYRNCLFTIVYTGGYTEGSVPDGLSRAALLQTGYEYQSVDVIGAESVSTEGGTVRRPAIGILKHVVEMLRPYIHPLFGCNL